MQSVGVWEGESTHGWGVRQGEGVLKSVGPVAAVDVECGNHAFSWIANGGTGYSAFCICFVYFHVLLLLLFL